MSFTKGKLIYEGKAKKIFTVQENENLIVHEFKNSLTAFNGEKKGEMLGKSRVNQKISSLLYKYLQKNGVPTHFIETLSDTEILTYKLEMIALEVVVRNVAAGSLTKRLGVEEGQEISPPLVEFYLKDDALGDPFLSDAQAIMLKLGTEDDLEELKRKALMINQLLFEIFEDMGLRLVDFKLEFGRDKDKAIVLGDEISPDTCRLWDIVTGEKMDKDRFRLDLGSVEEGYKEVLNRIENVLEVDS